jgi:hypothetical protein
LKAEENQGWSLLFETSEGKSDENYVLKTTEDNNWEIYSNQNFGDITDDISLKPKIVSKFDRDYFKHQ